MQLFVHIYSSFQSLFISCHASCYLELNVFTLRVSPEAHVLEWKNSNMKISKMTLNKLSFEAQKYRHWNICKLPLHGLHIQGLRDVHGFLLSATSKHEGRDRPFGSPLLIVFAIYLQSNCLFNDLPLFALTILPGKLFHTFMILCVEKKKKEETLPDICSEFVFL